MSKCRDCIHNDVCDSIVLRFPVVVHGESCKHFIGKTDDTLKHEWINVKDKLPDENLLVLCHRNYNYIDLCHLEKPFTYLNDDRYYWFSLAEQEWISVHDEDCWMPLPAPPDMKGGTE